jgi:hypothetical protein
MLITGTLLQCNCLHNRACPHVSDSSGAFLCKVSSVSVWAATVQHKMQYYCWMSSSPDSTLLN